MFWSVIKFIRVISFQFFFVLLLDLAFGAVTYFSFRGFTTLMDGPEMNSNVKEGFIWLIVGNGMEAALAVFVLRLFVFVDKKIRRVWVRCVVLGLVVYMANHIIYGLFFTQGFTVKAILYFNLIGSIFTTNIVLAAVLVYLYQHYDDNISKKITEQEYQLLELRELKTKAELEALQAKINPHFLYNALNSIASLVHEDPDKAEQMVLLLAKFFRYSTNAKSQYLTRLIDEIEMVKTYLEVEKVRFDERLEYTIWFENDDLKECLVPQFLIQPLVENAIKHGISKSTENGKLGIKIFDAQTKINILIYDNGAPFPSQITSGYGLRSTQDKLRMLMGEEAKMEILNGRGNYLNGKASDNEDNKAIKITMPKQWVSSVSDTEFSQSSTF